MLLDSPTGRGADAGELLEAGKLSRTDVHKFGGNAVRPSTPAQGPGLLDFLQPCCSFPNHKPVKCGSGSLSGQSSSSELTGGPRNHAREGALDRSQLNANSFLPDFLLHLHSLTSWISGPRRPVDQNPHTASTEPEANLHLRFFPRTDLVPYPPRI